MPNLLLVISDYRTTENATMYVATVESKLTIVATNGNKVLDMIKGVPWYHVLG